MLSIEVPKNYCSKCDGFHCSGGLEQSVQLYIEKCVTEMTQCETYSQNMNPTDSKQYVL